MMHCSQIYMWVIITLLVVGFAHGLSSHERCMCCKGTARQLVIAMENDSKITGDVDLRGRINPQGQRLGRRIEYRNSEVRLENILDNTCSHISTNIVYKLYPNSTSHGIYVERTTPLHPGFKSPVSDHSTTSLHALDNVCLSLVHAYKYEIWDLIKSDANYDTIVNTLCYTLQRPSRLRSKPLCNSDNDDPALFFPDWLNASPASAASSSSSIQSADSIAPSAVDSHHASTSPSPSSSTQTSDPTPQQLSHQSHDEL
uniref:Protein canopy 4 n=1 Tax=Lygus hesperus TaxID=30085 RepID=A0A0A9VUJ4_LYGHE